MFIKIIKSSAIFFIVLFFIALGICIGDYYYNIYYASPKKIEEARKIEDSFWDKPYENVAIKSKYRMVIITSNGGEWAESQYLLQGARNLGWEGKIFFYTSTGYEDEIIDFDPDFILFSIGIDSRMSQKILDHRSKKICIYYWPINTRVTDLFIYDPLNIIYTDQTYAFDTNLEPNKRLRRFIAHSDAMLITAKEIKVFQDFFNKIHRKFYGIRTVPSVNNTDISFKKPQYISLIGYNDGHRNNANLKDTLIKLSNDKILRTYGQARAFWYISKSYQGFITNVQNVLNTLNKNGISLIVHRKEHFENATPTNRIMEAAAANTLIICDRNPFVIEHFGDSVLYFDINADSETMYQQIRNHYDWAKANPQEAKKLANRAHKIFKEKFTSEKDLIRIAKLYEKMLIDEKALNLEYPYKP
jgi:glycosyltransferase involved in cell wall biosynthesis